MREQVFKFIVRGLKICSLNSSHNKNFQKTKDTNIWLQDFSAQLRTHQQNISEIKKIFNHKHHFLSVEYYWILPFREFFTRKGTVNARHGDWSNFPKIPDDELFNRVLGIDDSNVCAGKVYKLPWNKDYHVIVIHVSILSLDLLNRKVLKVLPEFLK